MLGLLLVWVAVVGGLELVNDINLTRGTDCRAFGGLGEVLFLGVVPWKESVSLCSLYE